VRDIVRGNILAATKDTVGKAEVLNLGGGHNVSVLEIAELVGGETVHVEARLEPKDTLADTTKAKNVLGWEPTVTFAEGIAELKQIAGV
jgi:UDP-glucose 4-epimerase